MKNIAVVTSTRAEYGLLSPVIKALRTYESPLFRVDLIVSGTHLCDDYGMTVSEIDDRIDQRVSVSIDSKTGLDISSNQADVLVKFSELFYEKQYDAILLLGDRYETLSVAVAASNLNIPIMHMCGGDTTEGAIDEWIRHAITKMSYLHFTTNEESRRRVIQLGESPERVFNYGSTSIDNALLTAEISKTEALKRIGMDECAYALCTFHPVTLENSSVEEQMKEVIKAICAFPEIIFIVTKSNADCGGERINHIWDETERMTSNIYVFSSLGSYRYLSLMRYAEFVLGNSSSGIIEAPAFHIPTVNIGDRQRGRLRSESIIDCKPSSEDIVTAINKARDPQFRETCKNNENVYGDGHTAQRIATKIMEIIEKDGFDLKKRFYDYPMPDKWGKSL